jgi:hypothetical protein
MFAYDPNAMDAEPIKAGPGQFSINGLILQAFVILKKIKSCRQERK